MTHLRFASVFLFAFISFSTAALAQEMSNPSARFAELKKKFDGATTCSAAECHGGGATAVPPAKIGSEFNIWKEKDAHRLAFESLTKPNTEKYPPDAYPNIGKIGANLKIADVTKENRCLVCHALNVPENLRGVQFAINEGNSCTACHGPSEDWRLPHKDKAWTAAQRKQFPTHVALLKGVGIYDTKVLSARADLCVGCHLAIDADLVAAGHPQPAFELDFFQESMNKHWISDPGGYFSVKVWAAGQAACVRDALLQLASRNGGKASDDAVKDAWDQAMAHWTMLQLAAQAGGFKGDLAGVESAMKTLAGAKGKDAAAANAGAAAAAKLADSVDSYAPDRKAAGAILSAIASSTIYADAGVRGASQQAYGIYTLFNAIARNEKPADADATMDLIGKLFPPPGAKTLDSAQFAKDLAAAKAKLPT